ncbi:catechol 2,3-dioxygenase-like lactoylglutathione lyase family enzyme [Bradyrhizobium elkanii]
MIGYVTLGTNDLPRAAAFYFRDLDGNKLNAFAMESTQ